MSARVKSGHFGSAIVMSALPPKATLDAYFRMSAKGQGEML
jgi:hypothetical protein